MKKAFRSVLAILAGLILITLIAETIEFCVVTALHGSVTTDQETYFAIRNRPGVLAFKLVYNTLAALAGGFVCAWIAGRTAVAHGLTLAAIQAIALIYGMTASEYANTTPRWMWLALIALSTAGIMTGAWLRSRKQRTNS